MSDDPFLSRWSRLKREAKAPKPAAEAPAAPVAPAVVPDAATAGEPPAPLPPVESLTTESDFTPFMKPEVDPATRRAALKTLFQDPQFNVMDGLDVYIDDYSKPDPLPEGWLEKMNQYARLSDHLLPREDEKKAPKEGEALPAETPAAALPEAALPAPPAGRFDTCDEGTPSSPMKESAPESGANGI